jgi:hypothetical protein
MIQHLTGVPCLDEHAKMADLRLASSFQVVAPGSALSCPMSDMAGPFTLRLQIKVTPRQQDKAPSTVNHRRDLHTLKNKKTAFHRPPFVHSPLTSQ